MMGPDILHLSTSRKVEEICQQCFILFFSFEREINKKEKDRNRRNGSNVLARK